MERAPQGVWSAYESSTGHIYDTCFFLVFGWMSRVVNPGLWGGGEEGVQNFPPTLVCILQNKEKKSSQKKKLRFKKKIWFKKKIGVKKKY